MKKLVKILNSSSSKLDEILSVRRTEKKHFGLGYTGQLRSGQTIFVKETSFGTNEEKDVKQKRPAATPIITPAVMVRGQVAYHMEEHQEEQEEGIGFQSVIIVTKRSYQAAIFLIFFADLRRANQQRFPPRRPERQ